MKTIHPASKTAQLVRIIAEGPATTAEIMRITEWEQSSVDARAKALVKAKILTREPHKAAGERSKYVWKLASGLNMATLCYRSHRGAFTAAFDAA